MPLPARPHCPQGPPGERRKTGIARDGIVPCRCTNTPRSTARIVCHHAGGAGHGGHRADPEKPLKKKRSLDFFSFWDSPFFWDSPIRQLDSRRFQLLLSGISQVLDVLLASLDIMLPRPQSAPAPVDDVLKLVSNLAAGMAGLQERLAAGMADLQQQLAAGMDDVQERLVRIEAAMENRGGDRDDPGASTAETALTWPKNARVSLKSAREGSGLKLVKFPTRDVSGGVFASLQARGPSLPPEGPFFPQCSSFRGGTCASLQVLAPPRNAVYAAITKKDNRRSA